MKKQNLILLFCLLLIVTCRGTSKDKNEISSWLKNLVPEANKWESTITITADFEHEVIDKGVDVVLKGFFAQKAPNKSYIKIVTPEVMKGVIICNGKKNWNYMEKHNVVLITDIKKREQSFEKTYGLTANEVFFNKPRYLGEKVVNSEEVLIVEGDYMRGSNKNNAPSEKRQLMIGKKDGIVRQLIAYDMQGNVKDKITYFNIRTNKQIDDSFFEFVLPKNVSVINTN